MFCCKGFNLFTGHRSEDLYVTLGVVIAHVEPELIEFVRRCVAGIEPNVARLSFAKLATVGFSNQGTSKCKSLATIGAADKFRTCGNVTPLVAAAHLQFAVFCFVKMEEVIALKQLISKLSERQTVASLAIETALHAVLSHHIVYGDVLTHLACEVEEAKVLHPVVVVDQFGCIWRIAVEVKEFRQLLLDALLVVAQHFLCE